MILRNFSTATPLVRAANLLDSLRKNKYILNCDPITDSHRRLGMAAEEKLKDPCEKLNGELFENGTVVDEPPEKENDEDTKGSEKSLPPDKPPNDAITTIRESFKMDDAAKENNCKSNHINRCCAYLRRQTAVFVWAERVILISICIAIAGGFTVPVIIYALDTDRGDNSTLSIDLDVDNCPMSTIDIAQV